MNKISVVLTRTQMEELHKLYQYLRQNYKIIKPHNLLLYGHLCELAEKIQQRVRLCLRKYTVTLEGTDLVAFVQLWVNEGRSSGGVWDNMGLELTEFQLVIVQKFIVNLDRVAHTHRIVHDGRTATEQKWS
jgi:hypothetical protein